jgi:Outer membrane protein beta-barrel domain
MRRLLALLVFVGASPASAQGFEAILVAGYTTEGGLEPRAAGISDLGLEDNFSWGASAGYFFSPRFGVEASWTRQQSGLEIGTAAGSARMFDVDIDQFHGSFVWRLGAPGARLRPFFAAGIGASLFSAPELQSETKLSLSLASGLRWMPMPTGRVGARLQVRYAPSHLADAESDFCDPFGFCQDWLHQLQLTGGVVVGF